MKSEQPSTANPDGGLSPIQRFEIGIRRQKTQVDLTDHLVNRLPEFFAADQALYGQLKGRGFKITAGSAVADVSQDSAYIQSLQSKIKRALQDDDRTVQQLSLGQSDQSAGLPFGLLVRVPMGRENHPSAVLLAKSKPWKTPEQDAAAYLAGVYDHAFLAMSRPRGWGGFLLSKWVVRIAVLACLAALFLVPAKLSVIAPARVVPAASVAVTAPVSGRIAEVLTQQGNLVSEGDLLLQLDDQLARDQLAGAKQKLAVSTARHAVLLKRALTDPNARQELSVAEAEVTVAEIEVAEAEHLVQSHAIRAARSGEVLANDLLSLTGETVEFGASIARIMTPSDFVIEADVPVDDSELVYDMREARVFLSDAPLTPRDLTKRLSPSEPRLDERGSVSYPVRFDFTDDASEVVLGMEGSVQIFGSHRPLIYTLLRRPIMWLGARLPVW